MSKAAKKSLIILMVLLIAALGFAIFSFLKYQQTQEEKARLAMEYSDARDKFEAKEAMHIKTTKQLRDDISQVTVEKDKMVAKVKEVEEMALEQADDLMSQITEVSEERDKWKRRIDTIKEERDQLMAKITALTKQLEEKEQEMAFRDPAPEPAPVDLSKAPTTMPTTGRDVDEQYWADLLQQKASLEVEMNKLKGELSNKAIALVDIKQNNENLKLEVDTLKREKREIENEIKHKTDMIDNLSLELARTKNDKKFVTDRVEKLNEENSTLRSQMKQLVSVKNALEKSIVKVTQEKDKVENQLGKTETLIQSKIDEIWDIKDELDHSIRSTKDSASSSNEVELPPIVVSSNDGATSFNTGASAPNLNGRVISVNEPNNFVIVDLGENSGIRLGDSLSVYRDSKYIARLEVIQVRKDIAAADLKDQWSKVKVGDVIR